MHPLDLPMALLQGLVHLLDALVNRGGRGTRRGRPWWKRVLRR